MWHISRFSRRKIRWYFLKNRVIYTQNHIFRRNNGPLAHIFRRNNGLFPESPESPESLESLESLEPLEPLDDLAPLELDILETAGKFNGTFFLKKYI